MPARELTKQDGAPNVDRMSLPRILVSRHYGIPKTPPPRSRGTAGGPEEAPARKLAKQGGTPAVDRMTLPRILVSRHYGIQRAPPPMSRGTAGGPEEAPARKLAKHGFLSLRDNPEVVSFLL